MISHADEESHASAFEGTGSLAIRRDSAGRESWYGQWWKGSRRVKRRIGPKRLSGTREGLTKAQAEAELRRMIDSTSAGARVGERLDLAEPPIPDAPAGPRQAPVDAPGLRDHPAPPGHLLREGRGLDEVRPEDAQDLIGAFRRDLARREGLRPELRFHYLRHTFSVRMAAAGATMRLIQAWMGHASVTTTDVYARFSADPMQARAWANRAFAMAPSEPDPSISTR